MADEQQGLDGQYGFGGPEINLGPGPVGPPSMLPPSLFSANPFAVPMPPLPTSDNPSRSYHSVPPPGGRGGRGGGRGRGAARGGM